MEMRTCQKCFLNDTKLKDGSGGGCVQNCDNMTTTEHQTGNLHFQISDGGLETHPENNTEPVFSSMWLHTEG